MRSAILLFLVIMISGACIAQTAPPNPATCKTTSGTGIMTITGATAFDLNTLEKFTASESFGTIYINVESSKPYRVYIAGEVTGMVSSSTNSPIPIGSFTAVASLAGTGPAVPFVLNGNSNYQLLVEVDKTTANTPRAHQLTITRNALSNFTQAPGAHTLYLHFYFCQY